MSFDIGPAGDLAIFTNTQDDLFNISGDIGPSFIIDSGQDSKVVDLNVNDNITSGVTVDIPNEAPIDFGAVSTKPSSGFTGFQRRQKIESNVSEATIEAEPMKKKVVKSGFNSSKPVSQVKTSQVRSSAPRPEIFTKPFGAVFKSTERDVFSDVGSVYSDTSAAANTEKQPDIPSMSFGFDDLLDNRKLKPVNDETASNGGDSYSTIKGNDYPMQQGSPEFRAFRSDSPELPSTFQSERKRSDTPRESRRPEPTPQYNTQPNVYQETSKYANEEDEKIDLLLKLRSLEERGRATLSKNYSIKSSIDEIRMEYRNQMSAIETQSTVNFMRNGLIFCTSGIEYMNRRFDPLGAKLDGWGESVMENVMDYDGIFERLHHKYKGNMEMEPEMELLFALAGSAFMFHLTNSLFKTAMPQFGSVLKENPDVMKGIYSVVQEASKRGSVVQAPSSGPAPANDLSQSTGIDFSSLLNQVGLGNSGFAKSIGQAPPAPQSTRDFRDPPVNDLYRQMVSQGDIDDTLSVSSETSDRVIGSKGSAKAVITPLPSSKRGGGGNILKLL